MNGRAWRSIGLMAVAALAASTCDDGPPRDDLPPEPAVFFEQPDFSHALVYEPSFEVGGRFSGSVNTIDLRIDGGDSLPATRTDDGGWRVAASRVSVSPGLHLLTATATGDGGTSPITSRNQLWVYYETDPSVTFHLALEPETSTYTIPFSGIEDSPELLLLGPPDDIRLDITVESPAAISADANAVLHTGGLASLDIEIVDEVPGVYPILVTTRSEIGEVHEATHTVTLIGQPGATTPPPTAPPTTGVPDPGATAVLVDNFDGPDQWTATTTRSENGATATAEPSSGGNPGGQRRMTHVLPGTSDGENNPSQITVQHLFNGGGWDPATDGALASINYREDQIEFDPPFDGAAIGTTFVIVQDGTTYTASISENNAFSNTVWQTVRADGLVPADFSPAPGPDFSASGAPMTFGYSRGNTSRSAAGITTQHGIDNWTVELFGAA